MWEGTDCDVIYKQNAFCLFVCFFFPGLVLCTLGLQSLSKMCPESACTLTRGLGEHSAPVRGPLLSLMSSFCCQCPVATQRLPAFATPTQAQRLQRGLCSGARSHARCTARIHQASSRVTQRSQVVAGGGGGGRQRVGQEALGVLRMGPPSGPSDAAEHLCMASPGGSPEGLGVFCWPLSPHWPSLQAPPGSGRQAALEAGGAPTF